MTEVKTLKLGDLKPSPANVRQYESTEVEALANSIKNVGVLQSLLVKPNGKHYEVIAGGRRLAAMHSIKFKGDIPVNVIDADACETEASLSENIYRQPLHDYQIWQAILSMNNGSKPTVKEAKAIAKRLHFTQDEVRKTGTLAASHPELLAMYEKKEISVSVLEYVAHLEPEDQLALVTNVFEDENVVAWNRGAEIKKRAGHLSYKEDHMLEAIGGIKAYRKAGGKYSANLFGSDTIIHDKALLAKLYEEALVEEDKKLAAEIEGVSVLETVPADWSPCWISPTFETDADAERWYEIRENLYDDMPDENRQALEEEQEEIESRKKIILEEGYEYGVHHGRYYRREIGDGPVEEVTETVTPLSGKATDFFKEEKLALMQRVIVEHADDPEYEGKLLCFVLARLVAGPRRIYGTATYLTVEGELPDKEWMTMKDDKEAWLEFTRQQPEDIAKDIAWTWTSLFTKSLEPSFLSDRVCLQGVRNIWEMPEDFFKLYHKADQLEEIARDMGVTELQIQKFNDLKLKEKRAYLEKKYAELAKKGKQWLPPQLRDFKEVP